MQQLNFISEHDLIEHVRQTITNYGDKLKPFNLRRLNKNIIDPIKLLFDKAVYHLSWEEIVKSEILRQRDKANNNDIGYFHQRIFQYIQGCEVPANGTKGGWDVIFSQPDGMILPDGDRIHKVYVEMKNKHNTMNSASSGKTYIKMQNQLLADDDCACFLVEAIAKQSQNIKWSTSIDGRKLEHKRIRRVSLDRFYALVTHEEDAFYQLCMALPEAIRIVVGEGRALVPQDTALQELEDEAAKKQLSMEMAAFLLGFPSYIGFNQHIG